MSTLRAFQAPLLPCAALLFVAVAGSLGGCAPRPEPAALPTLQLRASFDLACPPQEVQVIHFDQRTKGVVGCGRRLIYVASCDESFARGACTWVLDSPASWPAASAPVAPPGGRPASPNERGWPTPPAGPVPPASAPSPVPTGSAWPPPSPGPASPGPPIPPDLQRPDFGF